MTNGSRMCQWASKMAGPDRCPGEGAERPDWGTPPGSAGVPPAHVLAQTRPPAPPVSTGNGARTLLRPGLWRSRRQGGRVRHRGETERNATEQHAGETPALPGGRQDSASAEPTAFPPAGWPGAPSRGNRAERDGTACGRDARAPGWAPLPITLAPQWIAVRVA